MLLFSVRSVSARALIVLCIAAPMLIHSILPWIRDKGDQAT